METASRFSPVRILGAVTARPANVSSSFVESDRPRESSVDLDIVVFVSSVIPKWLKLKSPWPRVFTASSFSSVGFPGSDCSPIASTSGLSTCGACTSCVPLLFLVPPDGPDVFVILLLKVFAAFCAAEKTDEKNPLCPGVIALFSGVGVNGAAVILESLLGPKVAEPDRIRRCEIMFPEGDVTTFVFETVGEVGLESGN